jgi:hypothetical protein
MNDKKENLKKLIQKEITHFREDTFVNHVKSWWSGDGEISGVVSENGFKIWSCSRRQSGIMHVVVQGVFIENNEPLKVLLKPKINIAGKIFLTSFLVFWAFGCWHIGFESIIIRCLLFLVFPAVFVLGYNSERKIILEAVEKIISV